MKSFKSLVHVICDTVTIRHAALVAAVGTLRALVIYSLLICTIIGSYERVQNIYLRREVIRLSAERDLMAHKLDATLEVCTQAVVDAVSKLHDRCHKIEVAQAEDTKRLDELLLTQAPTSPTADKPAPVETAPVKVNKSQVASNSIVASVATNVAASSRHWYYLWLK